jgi:hypothetical protein
LKNYLIHPIRFFQRYDLIEKSKETRTRLLKQVFT